MEAKAYKRIDVINFFTVKKLVTFHDFTFESISPKPGEHHDFCEVQLCGAGQLVQSVDGREVTLSPGDLLFLSPNTFHKDMSCTPGTRLFIASFVCDDAAIASLGDRITALRADEAAMFTELVEEGVSCFERIPDEAAECGLRPRPGISPGRLQALKNRLEIFLIKLSEAHGEKPAPRERQPYRTGVAERVFDYLCYHVNDRVTLGEIASELAASASYIKREFKKKYGRGVIDYLLAMKMEKARRLIAETPLSFTQIAEYLSFDSEGHFSKTFIKREGITPSEYLRRFAESAE